MLRKHVLVTLCVMAAGSLLAVACIPVIESQNGAFPSASMTPTVAVQVEDGGEVVQTTPLPDEELAVQPPGQAAPGPDEAGGGAEAGPGSEDLGAMRVYADSNYDFSVTYPASFVFRTLPDESLAQWTPSPVAGFTLMNPTTAASDVVELEPADLEIRVYSVDRTISLERWLAANGLTSADSTIPPKTIQMTNVSVLEVCISTLIAPGCSYFVMNDGWIYGLTPATLEGEAIMKSLNIAPNSP